MAHAGNNFLEHDAQFQPRQVGTQAKMLAYAEGAVLVIQVGHALGAGHIKLHGILAEDTLIVIDCVVVQDDLVAFPDELAADLGVCHRGAAHDDKRGVIAQHLLTGVGYLVRVIHQILQLLRVLHQLQHAVAGHCAGRFVAGRDQHEEKPDELFLTQALFALGTA